MTRSRWILWIASVKFDSVLTHSHTHHFCFSRYSNNSAYKRKISTFWGCCRCKWLFRVPALPHTHTITSFFPSEFADFPMKSAQSGVCWAAEAPQSVCHCGQIQEKKARQCCCCWCVCVILSASGPQLPGPSIEIQEPDRCCPACSGLWTTALFPKMAALGNFQRFQGILWKIWTKISFLSLTLNSTSGSWELPVWLCFSSPSFSSSAKPQPLPVFVSFTRITDSQPRAHSPSWYRGVFFFLFYTVIK